MDTDSSSDDDRHLKRRRSHSSRERRRRDSSSSRRHKNRSASPPVNYRTSPSRRKSCPKRSSSYMSSRESRKHRSHETESEDEGSREKRCKLAEVETKNKTAERAKEKLSVLAKLGIQLKLPEQDRKKKLWTNDKGGVSGSAWKSASFGDGKLTAKFQRLMGIKGAEDVPSTSNSNLHEQEKFLQIMEAQYEVARQTTHSLRGAGLGFAK